MTTTTKQHAGALFAVIFIIVAVALLVLVGRRSKESEPIAAVPVSQCGLTVHAPLPGDTVSFPLELSATVDNTQRQELGCGWTVFEAQAGVVYAVDAAGNDIGMGLLTVHDADTDWMTSEPVAYSATVATVGAQSGDAVTLRIVEDDPSGTKVPSVIEIPLTVR